MNPLYSPKCPATIGTGKVACRSRTYIYTPVEGVILHYTNATFKRYSSSPSCTMSAPHTHVGNPMSTHF